jgi:predicted glycoside hydrolase/deacetylase ChbG (UPF0249 family)
MERRLIVNADDFGLTRSVNRAIARAHNEGIVTSTSVMVNQTWAGEVTDLRSSHSRLGIGLHVTLTLGTPAAQPVKVRSLLDGDGRFLPQAVLLERLRHHELVEREVQIEAQAQLKVLRAFGVEPDHWNVHQHLQEWRELGSLLAIALAAENVRVTRNGRRLSVGVRSASTRARDLRAGVARRRASREIARLHRMPDALLDLPASQWASILSNLPRGVVEAICHPGEARDDELMQLTPSYVAERTADLDALLDARLRRTVDDAGIQLSTFTSVFF